MQMQPLIKQGWLRVLIFVIVLVTATVIMTRAGNAIVYGLNPGSNATADPGVTKQQLVLFSLLITFLASAGTVFLFRKFIDKHTLISLGLDFNGYHYHAATGFFWVFFYWALVLSFSSPVKIFNGQGSASMQSSFF